MTAALTAALSVSSALVSRAEEGEISYDQVAAKTEMTSVQAVGVEGMFPVYGKDIADGIYEVEVECSSNMFRVEKAVLTVEDGVMQADLILDGNSYLKLYPGTGAEAAAAELSDYIDNTSAEAGKTCFTIPVEALDQPMACAAFSRSRKKWYDRQILLQAESLPEEAVMVELPDYDVLRKAAKEKRIAALRAEKEQESEETPATVTPAAAPKSLQDGTYSIEITFQGGTGRTAILSPAALLVQDGKSYARIEWSSSNYDYMLVGSEKYLPVQSDENTTENSVFEIPIEAFDEPLTVIGDTVAMGTPHEIEYTLTFQADSIKELAGEASEAKKSRLYLLIEAAAVCLGLMVIWKRGGLKRRG